MDRLTRPLFRFDAGWLFIAAGLAVCASGILLPAQADLEGLQHQLERLRSEEARAYARLRAHADFMDQVDRADPALIRRLAATQLNMVPEGDEPVLLAASASLPVTHWIEAAVQVDMRPPKTAPDSMLSKLANGPHRLWMFGGGIMAVFIGLLLGPGTGRGWRDDGDVVMIDDESHDIDGQLQDVGIGVGLIEAGEASRIDDEAGDEANELADVRAVVDANHDAAAAATATGQSIPDDIVEHLEGEPREDCAADSQSAAVIDDADEESTAETSPDDAAGAVEDDHNVVDGPIESPPPSVLVLQESDDDGDVDDDRADDFDADRRESFDVRNRMRERE